MRVYIWKDEAYPVYGIDKDIRLRENTVVIPDELLLDYYKVEKEYERVQEELKKYSCE